MDTYKEMDTLSGEVTLSKLVCLPSRIKAILKEKNLLPFVEPFQKSCKTTLKELLPLKMYLFH